MIIHLGHLEIREIIKEEKLQPLLVLIAALNVEFHLFQEMINQFTVAIVSDKINRKIQEMIDIPEMIEVHDVPILEIHTQVGTILDLKNQQK